MSSHYQEQASWNGVLVSADTVRVSALSDGVMFGRGLFETLRVARGQPAFFSAHVQRLKRSCAALGLPWDPSEETLRGRCLDVIGANALVAGALKLMVFADTGGAAELIVTRDFVYPKAKYESGFRLLTQTTPRQARHGAGAAHKTTSYLENLLARERARAADCDDALFVDATGQVLEGAATNVFVVVGDQVLTPPEDFGLLPGIARAQIVRHAAGPGYAVQTAPVSREALLAADEVFVTNALLGVMPVAAVDTRTYDLGKNTVTRQLMREYQGWMLSSLTAP